MRSRAATVVAVLLGLVLVACGAEERDSADEAAAAETSTPAEATGSPEAYCDLLAELDDVARPGPPRPDDAPASDRRVQRMLALVADLAEAAPPGLADDWQAYADAWEEYLSTVEDEMYRRGDAPAGTSEDDRVAHNLRVWAKAVKAFARTRQPLEAITAHARSECGLDLGG